MMIKYSGDTSRFQLTQSPLLSKGALLMEDVSAVADTHELLDASTREEF